MSISISPELEQRLVQKAAKEGVDVDAVAEALLSAALDWETRDSAEAIEGVRRGLEASAAGRVRSAEDVFGEMRAKLAPGQR